MRGVGLITVQIINCTKSYIVTAPVRADREKLVINDQHPVILLTVIFLINSLIYPRIQVNSNLDICHEYICQDAATIRTLVMMMARSLF